eukprot:1195588-Prorocentrum_minimum.AAC.1
MANVLAALPPKRQTLLFSATLTRSLTQRNVRETARLQRGYSEEAVRVCAHVSELRRRVASYAGSLANPFVFRVSDGTIAAAISALLASKVDTDSISNVAPLLVVAAAAEAEHAPRLPLPRLRRHEDSAGA